MQVDLIKALGKYPSQLPRYTSYPTAPHFHALSPELYNAAIEVLPHDEAISLYLHIPFCKQLCWFCGCHTKITRRYEPVEKYLALLLQEIALFRQQSGHTMPVSHIHFGGGSPTLLEPVDITRCMQALHYNFDIKHNAQIAIEIDPRTVNEAKIAAYMKAGVNRVSIGVQDFEHGVQVAVNRIQPFNQVYEVVNLCRDYGIEEINFDLIYGLPQQTRESIQRTIELALLMEPSRIALFGYAYVPWKKKNMHLIEEKNLPSEAFRLELWSVASKAIKAAGYVPIGLDHFAKPNDAMVAAKHNHTLKRNFQGYTVDSAETLIGFGASAISHLPQGYFQNVASTEDYKNAIMARSLPVRRGCITTDDDKLRRKIIEEIMCYLECDIKDIRLPDYDNIMSHLRTLAEEGLIGFKEGVIRVNSELPQVARIVCSLFDVYYQHAGAARHGKVA